MPPPKNAHLKEYNIEKLDGWRNNNKLAYKIGGLGKLNNLKKTYQ